MDPPTGRASPHRLTHLLQFAPKPIERCPKRGNKAVSGDRVVACIRDSSLELDPRCADQRQELTGLRSDFLPRPNHPSRTKTRELTLPGFDAFVKGCDQLLSTPPNSAIEVGGPVCPPRAFRIQAQWTVPGATCSRTFRSSSDAKGFGRMGVAGKSAANSSKPVPEQSTNGM